MKKVAALMFGLIVVFLLSSCRLAGVSKNCLDGTKWQATGKAWGGLPVEFRDGHYLRDDGFSWTYECGKDDYFYLNTMAGTIPCKRQDDVTFEMNLDGDRVLFKKEISSR